MAGKILITAGVFTRPGADGAECLRSHGLEPQLPQGSGPWDEDRVIAELQGCVAVVAGMEPYTDRVFAACPDLRFIARWGIGYDSIDVEAATRHGVMILNTPGVVTEAVADMTFALMLSIARQVPFGDRSVRAGQWPTIFSGQLFEKTLGVVGVGQIGQAVIRRAKGFSMRILAHDPYCEDGLCERLIVEEPSLEKLLAESDFVTLHCTMGPETRHLMNRDRFRLMKPTAYLINAGRGGLVDQAALTEALREGWIAGAGLDVLDPEPPDPNDPLLQLDNVVFMPHVSSFTHDTVVKVNQRVCENVFEALSGQPPRFVVNRDVLSGS